jgi:hypothetical protein
VNRMGRVLAAGVAFLLFAFATLWVLGTGGGAGDRVAFGAAFAGLALLSLAFLAHVNDHPRA